MANKYMFLKNTRTGDRQMIAKYYPSTGWYQVAPMDTLFDRNVAPQSDGGDCDYVIEYED